MNTAKTVFLMAVLTAFPRGGLTGLFSMHPPMEERIARIEGMARGEGDLR